MREDKPRQHEHPGAARDAGKAPDDEPAESGREEAATPEKIQAVCNAILDGLCRSGVRGI